MIYTALSIVAAIITGFVQMFLAVYAWGIYASQPVGANFLFSHYETPGVPILIFAHDLIVNALLWVPFIVVILMLRPKRPWLYLVAAVVPAFLWMNANVDLELLAWAWPHFLRSVATSFVPPVLVALIFGFVTKNGTTPNTPLERALK